MPKSDLRTLRVDSIIITAEVLHRRIEERFPRRNLKNISAEVVEIAQEARERIKAYSQPNYWLRSLIILALLLFVLGIYITIRQLDFEIANQKLFDILTILEAAINDAIFLGAAIFFLVTLEQRLKQGGHAGVTWLGTCDRRASIDKRPATNCPQWPRYRFITERKYECL